MIYSGDAVFTVHTRAAAGFGEEPYVLVIDAPHEQLAIRLPALSNVAAYLAQFPPQRVEVIVDPSDDPDEVAALRAVCFGAGVQ